MGKRINVELEKMVIWSDNPRHFLESRDNVPLDEKSAINILIDIVGEKKMFNLINDIYQIRGLMRNILPVVVKKGAKYYVYDGNRRVSALKIIKNPELVENVKLKSKVKKLLDEEEDLSFVDNVYVYSTDEKEALLMMDKMHSGEQDGVGLIPWEAFQRDASLISRGLAAQYPFAYGISEVMGLSRKSHFNSLSYTDLDRIFSSKRIQNCFGIIRFDDNHKKQISDAIEKLKEYKKVKNFKSFSREFNIINDKDENSPVNRFCAWVEESRNVKYSIQSDAVELYQNQQYDIKNHNIVVLNNGKKCDVDLDNISFKYIAPNGKERACLDSSIVGIWKLKITIDDYCKDEKIVIKEPLETDRKFNNSVNQKILDKRQQNESKEVPLKTKNVKGLLISFNGKANLIDINETVNELIDNINSLNVDDYKCLISVALRAILELTMDELNQEAIVFVTKSGWEEKLKEYKEFLLKDGLKLLCKKYPKVFSSYKTEENCLKVISAEKLASCLNLAAHKSTHRVNYVELSEMCKKEISPLIYYASFLLLNQRKNTKE